MRLVIATAVIVGLLSCNSSTDVKSDSSTPLSETKVTPDFSVALNFINDYTKFSMPKAQASIDTNWIDRNELLTDHFKTAYRALLDSARKEDPELGLGFDPIFDAQDFPDKGFSIFKADTLGGYVTVVGNDWKEFELVLKVVQNDKKWLVDGAGVINIPGEKRAKR